jgi:VRR-NUC domain
VVAEATLLHQGRQLPAELIILQIEIGTDEHGAWLNSRGLKSGVSDLVSSGQKVLKTYRVPLPAFVSKGLKHLYEKTKVKKGCPDLVIWNITMKSMRLVEVKCPHWDRPTPEQLLFIQAAESIGIGAKIVEWEFEK